MKKYSIRIAGLKKMDDKLIKFKDQDDVLMTSEEFLSKYRVFIDDIALFKEIEGRKRFRSQEYASIGIMDRNDLIQEAYLAFFDTYSTVNWKKINNSTNPEASLWSFLKKSTILRLQRGIYEKKDGIRITERAISNAVKEGTIKDMNGITTLFNKLDHIFFRNQEDTALTKYETDLLGYFLDVHLDEFLDLNFKGDRNWNGIERYLVKSFYGMEEVRKSGKELAEEFKISQSTIRSLIQRALNKLRSKESMELISNFCREYFISTNSLAREYAINQGLTK